MITEKSCGAIVYTKESGDIEYVIIRSREGIYGFPKGHMEENEGETETGLREVAEEQAADGLRAFGACRNALHAASEASSSLIFLTIDKSCPGRFRHGQVIYSGCFRG